MKWLYIVLLLLVVSCGKDEHGQPSTSKLRPAPPPLKQGTYSNATALPNNQSVPLLTSKEVLDELRLFGGTVDTEKIEDLLKKIKAAGLQDDPALIMNIAYLAEAPYTEEVLFSLFSHWPKGSGRNTLIPLTFQHWLGKVGLEKGEHFFANLPRSSSQEKDTASSISRELSKGYFGKDLVRGLAWIEGIPEGIDRDAAIWGMHDVIQGELEKGNRQILQSALAHVTSDFIADRLYDLGFNFLSKTNASEARDWLLSIDEDRPLAADKTALSRLPSDEAILYINKLYESNLNDRADSALVAFSDAYSSQVPQKALEWLAQVPPSPARDKSIAQAAVNWRQTDITAARNWAAAYQDKSVAQEALKWLK